MSAENSRTRLLRCKINTSVLIKLLFNAFCFQSTLHLPEVYPPLNIQIRGPSFDILENYQSFIHNTAENMGIDVSESWATPSKTFIAKTYNENSTDVRDSSKINVYERNVQVINMRSIDAPLLLDIIHRTIPEGVELKVHEHEAEHHEARFIPDPFIDGLKKELNEMEEREAKERAARAETTALKAATKEQRKLAELYGQQDDEEEEDE